MEKIETTERLMERISNMDRKLSDTEAKYDLLYSSHLSFKKNLALQYKYANRLKVTLAKTILALGVMSAVSVVGLGIGIHSMLNQNKDVSSAVEVETEVETETTENPITETEEDAVTTEYGQLLNCPLCGGEAFMNTMVDAEYTVAWVECKDCELKQNYYRAGTLSEAEKKATDDWNKRVEVNTLEER